MNKSKSLSEILNMDDSHDANVIYEPELSKSASWANLVDEEMSKNIENKPIKSIKPESYIIKNEDKKENNKIFNVDEILLLNYHKLSNLQMLEYNAFMSTDVRKYIKQCYEKKEIINYDLLLNQLKWMSDISDYLSKKMGLQMQTTKIHIVDNGIIPRSSYKFCEYGYECVFNYGEPKNNKKRANGCYAQHFVHNLVYTDIMALINYFKYKNSQQLTGLNITEQINYQELIKCINTISYVINHMYEELKNVEYYNIPGTADTINNQSDANKAKTYNSKKKNRKY